MSEAPVGQLHLVESPPSGSRSINCFEILKQIGEGAYGQVYKAREIVTGEIVAVKKIKMDNGTHEFPLSAMREIKILQKLHHPNVIKLKEVVTSPGPERDEHGSPIRSKYNGDTYLVFEYMDHDLKGLFDLHRMRFTIPQIKCYMMQLLKGLHYCHVNGVLHRDIKSANLLIDNQGNLKIADFGLARSYSKDDPNATLSNNVVTRWYKPPELLLGATKYGPAVDMWSVGCIFAELLHGKAILPGETEPEQLDLIYDLCGSPDEVNWPGVSKLPDYLKLRPSKQMKRRVSEVFRHFDRHALELLEKMLTLDPSQRITAEGALLDEYFWVDPMPCDPKSLPDFGSSHEFQMELQKRHEFQMELQKRQQQEAAKRPKLPPPPQQQHGRLPPQPMHHAKPPAAPGPSHHYGKQPSSGLPPKYPHTGNRIGGPYYPSRGGQYGYHAQGRGTPYASAGRCLVGGGSWYAAGCPYHPQRRP